MDEAKVGTHQISMWRYSTDKIAKVDDVCVDEAPLEIRLRIVNPSSSSSLVTQTWLCTMRTPGNDIALVRGLLLTSGIIDSLQSIVEIRELPAEQPQSQTNIVLATLNDINIQRFENSRRGAAVSSSCGVCGQKIIEHLYQQRSDCPDVTPLHLSPAQVNVLIQALENRQPLFTQTGGCHGAGIFNGDGKLIDAMEDIGRHNAVDKIIGEHASQLVQATTPFGLVISSRASYEILQKAAMMHVQMVIAVGSPSSLAIEVAKEMDITLLAFTRNNTFNIYSCPQRLGVLP